MIIKILGTILVVMAGWGLFTGKVMAGSRGLQPNYYIRTDSPILYYLFIVVYLTTGLFVIFSS